MATAIIVVVATAAIKAFGAADRRRTMVANTSLTAARKAAFVVVEP